MSISQPTRDALYSISASTNRASIDSYAGRRHKRRTLVCRSWSNNTLSWVDHTTPPLARNPRLCYCAGPTVHLPPPFHRTEKSNRTCKGHERERASDTPLPSGIQPQYSAAVVGTCKDESASSEAIQPTPPLPLSALLADPIPCNIGVRDDARRRNSA